MATISYSPPGAQLAAFLKSDHRLRALIGPVYAGRKSAATYDIVQRAVRFHRQRAWRWVVVRQRRDEIEAYTLPTIRKWIQDGAYDAKKQRYGYVYDLGDGIRRLLEIDFLAMEEASDRRRLPTLEASAVWLDDARNLSVGVLDDCRMIVGRYPGALEGGCAWRGIICTSRMPLPGHWLVERGEVELYRQPSGRSPQAENLGYLKSRSFSYEKLAKEEDPDWVRRHVDAEITAGAVENEAEAGRAAARASLVEFIRRTMPDIEPARHHRLIIDKLEKVSRGEIKRLMLFLPPGSAKSTYASVLFPPWFMGNHPSIPVIAASHSKELAERFGRRVRNIVGSPVFGELFGFGLSGDSGAAGRWETAKGGEYFAVGVDASVTGRRAGLGIIDDPVKGRAEADSLTVRQHCFDWYKADFWTRLLPNAPVIYIGTRWHDDDLAGRLLEEAKNGGEQWEVVSLPAIAGDNDALGRARGERLWPEWYTAEMFEIARRDSRNWSALYQQEPMPESGEYFKSEWIRWYESAPPREQLRTYGASDCAVSADGGDFTVHLVAGVDPNDDIYLLDLWRGQASSDVWVDAQLDLIQLWKPLDWGEEKGQIAKGVGPFLLKRQLERRIYVHRRQFPAVGDKAVRAQAIRGRTAMGRVYFPRRAPWAAEFVNELLRFPAGVRDDMVDTYALIGMMLDRLVAGDKPKPQRQTLRCANEMTMDEILSLCGPGGLYGRPSGGPSWRIQ